MSVGTYKVSSANLENSFITYEEVGLIQGNSLPYGIWASSINDFGQMGIGRVGGMSLFLPMGNPIFYPSATNSATPVSFTTGGWWDTYATTMLKSDGSLWLWGLNDYGQLGDGNRITKYSPFRLGTETYSIVTSGASNTFGIRTNGTLWSWGLNDYGQLGTGDPNHRSSPTQVGALTTWNKVSVERYHGQAGKTDGTLWGFGAGGNTGDNTNIRRSSPVQIGALTTWNKIDVGNSNSVALKTDGSLWTWGKNWGGQLGNNNFAVTILSSPAQVGVLTDWSQILASDGTVYSIKTTGALWTWGYNVYGNLAQGNYIHRSSPVQVGALTNWSKITANPACMMALKTDGTLWTWGAAWASQSGLALSGDEILSPIQVTSYSDWTDVWADGYSTTFAKRGQLYSRT